MKNETVWKIEEKLQEAFCELMEDHVLRDLIAKNGDKQTWQVPEFNRPVRHKNKVDSIVYGVGELVDFQGKMGWIVKFEKGGIYVKPENLVFV